MKIKQDPITGLWCREDGAILMPPSKKFTKFRWTFGSKRPNGYNTVKRKGKTYYVHQIVCRAFHGLAPEGKSEVDHINRIRDDNRFTNLRWVDHKENADNQASVDKSIEKYGVRQCDDRAAYDKAHNKAYYETHCEEQKAYQRAYDATKRAKMKAQGFAWGKGPNGKYGWYPKAQS